MIFERLIHCYRQQQCIHVCLCACMSACVHASALSNPNFPTKKKKDAMCHKSVYAL